MIPHFFEAASLGSSLHPLAAASCPYPTKVAGSSIWGPIARPLAAVLAWFYSLVPNYAFAIIGVGVAWTIIIAPLTLKSTRSMLAMQRLQPQMKKLQAEHKNDRMALNQAMQDLYKREGVSPLGGCLPMLLPFPVFIALFDVIDGLSYHHLVAGVRCSYPRFLSPSTAMFHAIFRSGGRLDSFGMDLAKNALSSHPSFLAALPYFALLLVMIGTQYLQSAQMYSRNPSSQDNPQMRFMKYLPILFGIIFIRFPAGVILYYAASSILRVFQQTLMYRFDPAVRRLTAKDITSVEKEIAEIDARKGAPNGSGGSGGSPVRAPRGAAAGARGSGNRLRDALAKQQEASRGRPTGPSGAVPSATPASGRPTAPPAPVNGANARSSTPHPPPATRRSAGSGELPKEPTPNGRRQKASRTAPGPNTDHREAAASKPEGSGRHEADQVGQQRAAVPRRRETKSVPGANGSSGGRSRTGARTGATSARPEQPRSNGTQKRGG